MQYDEITKKYFVQNVGTWFLKDTSLRLNDEVMSMMYYFSYILYIIYVNIQCYFSRIISYEYGNN